MDSDTLVQEFSIKSSGCPVIATYNALIALEEEVSEQTIVDLISYYETNGIAYGGKYGVSPWAIEDYFDENGYETKSLTNREEDAINQLAREYDTIIVTVYNNQDNIKEGLHTISITKDEDGMFTLHNTYNRDDITNEYVAQGGYETLYEAIMDIPDKSAIVNTIGINKKTE